MSEEGEEGRREGGIEVDWSGGEWISIQSAVGTGPVYHTPQAGLGVGLGLGRGRREL